MNIAVHALGRKKVLNKASGKEIFSQFYSGFGCVAQRALLSRNGCATILPSVPPHQTKFVSRTFQKITGAAARLHRE
jgi:hypothetical protein